MRTILSLLGRKCLLDHWVWHPGQKAGGQFRGLCGHLWFIGVWLPYATIDVDQVVPRRAAEREEAEDGLQRTLH